MSYSARYYGQYSHYLRMNLDDVPLFRFISAKCRGLGPGAVLDVGCGVGYLLNWLGKQGWRGVGVDLSSAAVAAGRRIYPDLEFFRSSVYDLPFADRSFDAVVSISVAEHLESPRQMVAEMNRVLKPGGALMLSTPEIRSLFKKLFVHDSSHVHEFKKEEIVGLVAEYCDVVDVTVTNSVGRLGRRMNDLVAQLMPCEILVEARKPELT